MATKTPEFLGTGRRKTSIARVRLATGSGKITVNGRAFDNYFPMETLRATVSQPLTVTGTSDKLDVKVNVTGGGPNGQAGAVRHGIARALLQFDANLRGPRRRVHCRIDVGDLAVEQFVGVGIDADGGRLAFSHQGKILLEHIRKHPDIGEIGNLVQDFSRHEALPLDHFLFQYDAPRR